MLRNYRESDKEKINSLAVEAFEQFQDSYSDWPTFRSNIANMAALSEVGEIIVAEIENKVVGSVAYIKPGAPKSQLFRPEWPIMRMLVVSPSYRGSGIGRALAEECLNRAKRDGASVFALHTSEIMQIALPMYIRMGFKLLFTTPKVQGVEYGVYLKELNG